MPSHPLALTPAAVAALRASHSPQAHRGMSASTGRLIISWEPAPNQLCVGAALSPMGCYIVSDFGGYLCATSAELVLTALIHLEHQGGHGAVRELITGEPLHLEVRPPPRTAAPSRVASLTPAALAAIEELL